MKLLFTPFLSLILFSVFAQNEVIIVQSRDTFQMYTISATEINVMNGVQTFVFNDFPDVVARTSTYSEGKLSGIEKTYYPSGKLYQTVVYQNGMKWGEYREYAEDGALMVSGMFIADLESGVWINKISGCTGKYKKGKKNGRWRCNEGSVPFTLYVYRKGILKRVKKNDAVPLR